MSNIDITTTIKDIKEIQHLIDSLTTELEAKKDIVKAEMTARNVSEISLPLFKVRYTDVETHRFDTTAFKKTHSELYNQYTKTTISKRFSIA